MSEKKRHIPQSPEGSYPKPGVKVDEAWKAMQKMLDHQMSPPPAGRHLWMAGSIAAGAALFFAAALYLAGQYFDEKRPDAIRTETTPPLSAGRHEATAASRNERTGNIAPHQPADTTGGQDVPEKAAPFNKALPRQTSLGGSPVVTPPGRAGRFDAPAGAIESIPAANTAERTDPQSAGSREIKTEALTNPSPESTLPTALQTPQPIHPGREVAYLITLRPLTLPPFGTIRSSATTAAPGNKPALPVAWGLEWDPYFPLTKGGTYFEDLKARRGVLLAAIPSVWLRKPLNEKTALTLTLKPVLDYYTGNGWLHRDEIERDSVLMDPNPDLVPGEIRLRKARGTGIALRVDRRLTDRLTAGAGLSGQLYWGALTGRRTGSPWTGFPEADSLVMMNRAHADWSYLRPYNLHGRLELLFRTGPLWWGGAINVPLLSFADKHGAIKPWNGQLLIRWPLN